ncbi:MAG TPA: TonB family protein [Acidobacteriaceae bacterium]
MATETQVRGFSNDPIGGGFAGSFLLHAALAGLLIGWTFFNHTGRNWGDSAASSGSIQATIVNTLPLPPKPVANPDNVLATDTPSPAPVAPKPHTEAAPKADAIPIPLKPTKPAKVADKATPPPPPHPQPAKIDPNKAQSGQSAAGIPMTSTQTRAGTFSVAAQDAAFGSRFPWYVQQITQKVAQQWQTPLLDPQAAGHRVYITFQIQRDGSPSNIQLAQRSGDNTLDQTALNAVQHIDTFPPLPDAYNGNRINVTYYFDPPPRP